MRTIRKSKSVRFGSARRRYPEKLESLAPNSYRQKSKTPKKRTQFVCCCFAPPGRYIIAQHARSSPYQHSTRICGPDPKHQITPLSLSTRVTSNKRNTESGGIQSQRTSSKTQERVIMSNSQTTKSSQPPPPGGVGSSSTSTGDFRDGASPVAVTDDRTLVSEYCRKLDVSATVEQNALYLFEKVKMKNNVCCIYFCSFPRQVENDRERSEGVFSSRCTTTSNNNNCSSCGDLCKLTLTHVVPSSFIWNCVNNRTRDMPLERTSTMHCAPSSFQAEFTIVPRRRRKPPKMSYRRVWICCKTLSN